MRFLLFMALAFCQNTAFAKSTGVDFLEKSLKNSSWVPLTSDNSKASIYDQALTALAFVAADRMELAGNILFHLSKQQYTDGALPFYFYEDKENNKRYIRSGALSWVGYAASHYLNASAKSAHREAILNMTHRIAAYLISQQITDKKDPRYHLITGGEGVLTRPNDVIKAIDLEWVSTEHNIDAYFFLRDFYKVTKQKMYLKASEEISNGLKKLWLSKKKHLSQGLHIESADEEPALDCASWGGLFFIAINDIKKAKLSLEASKSFLSADEKTKITGHKPYVEKHWKEINGVWPEGSAGVALLKHRLGLKKEAKEILNQLEQLRLENGALPDFTKVVAYEFDNKASIASTAWVEFVVQEIKNKKSFKLFGKK